MDMPIYAHSNTGQHTKTCKCWNFSYNNPNSNFKRVKNVWRFLVGQNVARVCFRVRKSIQVKKDDTCGEMMFHNYGQITQQKNLN